MTAPKGGLGWMAAVDRVWSKIDRSAGPSACWPWLGSRDRDGYGFVSLDITRRAHRVVFMLTGGEPKTSMVLHSCDNPPCCNPAHLRSGTARDNSKDMVERGRATNGERNGAYTKPARRPRGSRNGLAKLTEEQVAVIKRRLINGDTAAVIARDFGVVNGTIWFIAKGRNWAHIQPEAAA